MKNNSKILLFIIFASLFLNSFGQEDNTLFLMDNVPQSNFSRPSNDNCNCKLFIGMPIFSSIYFNLGGNNFTAKQLIADNIDINYILKKSRNLNTIFAEFQTPYLSIGLKTKNNYWTFNIMDKADIKISIPDDVFNLFNEGNNYFDKHDKLMVNNLKISGIYYREYSLGVTKKIPSFILFGKRRYKSLTIGGHAKLLFGKANIFTKSVKADYSATPDYFIFNTKAKGGFAYPGLEVSNDTVKNTDASFKKVYFNANNPGFAFDLGAEIKLNDKFKLYASLIDLGFIYWGDGISAKSNSDINIIGYSKTNKQDSITEHDHTDIIITKRPSVNFLNPKAYLAGTMNLDKYFSVGVLSRSIFYHSRLHTSLTFSGNYKLSNYLSTSLSYSVMDNRLDNFGIGLAGRIKGTQFYIVSNNLMFIIAKYSEPTAAIVSYDLQKNTFPFLKDINLIDNLNVRFGINLFFGCPTKIRKAKWDNDCKCLKDNNLNKEEQIEKQLKQKKAREKEQNKNKKK